MEKVSSRRGIIAAAVVGNILEWFDFLVYALLASIIFKLFFPADDPMMSILVGFGTFGIAFLVRPLGGVILGMYADRCGRRKALSLTFLIMAAATAMVAVLPTYAAIGIAAPILLIVCRLLQGFSAGGEFASATAVLVEFAPEGSKGLFGSLQMCSQALAVLGAAGVVFLLSSGLSADDFESWGWRIPFILGAVLGPVGLYIRSRMVESPEFRAIPRETARPLTELTRKYRVELVASIGLFAAVTAPNYVNSVYLPSVAVLRFGLSQADTMLGVLVAAAIMVILVPIFGGLSDRLPRTRVAIAGMVCLVVIYGLAFIAFLENPTRHSFFLMQALYAVPYAAFVGAACTMVLECFPVGVRVTGSSAGYNIAVAGFGGMTPFWLALVDRGTDSAHAPLAYVVMTMGFGVAGAVMLGQRGKATIAAAH